MLWLYGSANAFHLTFFFNNFRPLLGGYKECVVETLNLSARWIKVKRKNKNFLLFKKS